MTSVDWGSEVYCSLTAADCSPIVMEQLIRLLT